MSLAEPSAPVSPRPASRPRFLLPAVLLLLAPVLVGILIRTDITHPPFQSLDDTWLGWMGGPHQGVVQALATILDWFGRGYGNLLPVLAAVGLLLARRYREGLFVLAAAVATNVAVQLVKNVVDRPRPPHPLVPVDHGSFPSGHAALMATSVVIIGMVFVLSSRRQMWWPVAVVLTLAMMWSRTWVHAHWLSDTMAGAMIGCGATLLVRWSMANWLATEPDRGPAETRAGSAAEPVNRETPGR
ncbi:phosphatase PAP2 family protein [Streptomyces sp. NPDC102360]|uniref:phosphatase PAP2 family protein n=1 Tax=Streptomyces sp. NPDC102360 TaxID=3366160 RepID=UPI0038171688